MTEYQPPCKSNPDQWYTERDGRRYDDEVLVGEGALNDALAAAHWDGENLEQAEEVLDDLLDEAVKKRLVERRQAREGCFGCKIRLTCLDQALTNREQYGIWGGYFPEQRRTLERHLDSRDKGLSSKS